MFRSILVPLDRSTFAEQALPLATSIARRSGAHLNLVEVHTLYALDEPKAEWAPYEPDTDGEYRRREQLYLDATARLVSSETSVPASAAVLPGTNVLPDTVANSILERVRACRAELIVMATHGRTSLSRIGLGGVADELVRRADVPVLLVRPGVTGRRMTPEPALDNILIPLDGSPAAERVLAPVMELARLTDARCHLMQIIPPSADEAGAAAELYLACVAAKVRAHGLSVQTRVAIDRYPAAAIVEEAEARACDLIAMTTRGRGGLKRMALGSVTEKVIRGANSPVLVCRSARDER